MLRTVDAIALKAKLFRGFADPTRLAILETLLDGERSVGEIAQATETSLANVSAHLARLEGAPVVCRTWGQRLPQVRMAVAGLLILAG